MTIKQAAERYVANGWSVIPISRSAKKPTVAWEEYQSRLPTQVELDTWFDKTDLNIGIVTGKLSNLSVIDVDGDKGRSEFASSGINSPVAALTGFGKHLYFQFGDNTNTWESINHEGVDSRGEGGYVIAPPSVHASGKRYSWVSKIIPSPSLLPKWPKSFIQDTPKSVVATPSTEPWLIKALEGAGSGERHRTLVKLACYFIPRFPIEYVKTTLYEWNYKNTPPLADSEVNKQVDDLSARFKSGKYKSNFKPQAIYMEERSEPLDIKSPKQGLKDYLDTVTERGNFTTPELALGFKELDDAVWGLRRGSILTVGARPGTGKTSLCVNIAAHLCRLNKRVLFFSTEMSYDELYDKFLASEAEIKSNSVYTGSFTHEELARRDSFMKIFETFDLHVVNLFKPDEKAVRDAVDQVQPDVLIFDHIQHIASGDHEYGDISKFTKFLKEIAMQTNTAVLVASQLHRGAAADGVMPELHHLKGCGTIEEESSIVMLMHCEDNTAEKRQILFRIAKNRHGKCLDTTLTFNGDLVRFEGNGN